MLSLSNISVTVGRKVKKTLVNDISASIKQGKVTAFIGPNGAGKSSLLKAILGLNDISAGTITLEGQDISTLPAQDRAKKIAYLPQGQTAHWPMTVENIVALGRYPHGLTEGRDTSAIDAVIDMVGIAHLKDRIVTHLSGGERALVLLARALCVDADILLVDEPTASLDPRHQLEVLTLLKKQADLGKTVLIVMHDLGLATRFADELILMHHGQLVDQGTPDDVLTDKNLADVYGLKCGDNGLEPVDSP